MRSRNIRRRSISILLAASVSAASFSHAMADARSTSEKQHLTSPLANFVVTNTDNAGAGSLRQAVADAIAAGGGNITFSSLFNTPQTINLSTGGFSITTAITIDITGSGADLIDIHNTQIQHPTSTLFQLNNGATLSLKGVTLSGGNTDSSGGAILAVGTSTLTIDECSISNNLAAGSGGGIATGPNVTTTITNSTIYNNKASAGVGGGGIDNEGTLSIVNSTISKNFEFGTTGNNAGGIFTTGPTTITNSTITTNFTAGPNTGSAGGILDASSVTLKNSIVAANITEGIPDVTGLGTQIHSGGFNLIGNPGSMTSFDQPGDQTGAGNTFLDPKLAAISTNGGHTLTHRPLAGSPVINKGNSFGSTRDQRGALRPVGTGAIIGSDGSDIGAVEVSVRSAFDFDGDNDTDIGIFRANGASGAEWWIRRSLNLQVAAFQFGISTDVPVPADFTGDGKTDAAVWRPSTGQWFVLRSEDGSFFAFPFGAQGDIPAPADFDGDGKADAAVFRPSTSTWYIQRSSNGLVAIIQFGSAGDQPIPADYDGDGQADIGVFRPNGASGGAEWWIQRSTAGVLALQFGSSTDKAVPGDYTGDGRTDIAFWRPSTGQWFVLRSDDFSYFAFPFGTVGDVPAPGNYDGDGKWDAAVFRPSGNTFYVNQTTAGTMIVQFGSSTDRPIPNAFVRP